MNATNTFQDGLVMDAHPLATPNNVLTNCLNGTLITYNGNELILQNDVGNSKIPIEKDTYVQLKDGFVPIGLKEFGGILYIFSVNPKTNYCEIGTFPSPDYSNKRGKLIYQYEPLHNYLSDITANEFKKLSEEQKIITLVNSQFNTKSLNFDVEHPLTIDCQKSYDGSINLIFTDNKNMPRLINTRFSLYGDNEYELVDRSGDNDTNIYFEEDFEYSTSLHKIVNSIVDIKFDGVQTSGNLKVGTYTFYFTLADADDNESDFVGQSSMVTCHKGNLNDPFSIDGGIEDENSYKQVGFTLSNIPRQFSRVYVYYSRNSSDASGNALTTYEKINKYFEVNGSSATFIISGFEPITDVDSTTINTNYLTIDKAKAQSINQNILFYGNLSKQDQHYKDLENWALNNISFDFIIKTIGNVNPNFTISDFSTQTTLNDKQYESFGGYYNTNNIYNFVGYWPSELYRFGIVFILNDYSLTPVFNITGKIGEVSNKYGIIKFPKKYDLSETNVYGIKFNLNETLPKNVLGYFFVRQKRIKTILAQGVRIGSDQGFSYLPLLYIDKMSGEDDSTFDTYQSGTTYIYNTKRLQYDEDKEDYIEKPYFYQITIDDKGNKSNENTITGNDAIIAATNIWNNMYPNIPFDASKDFNFTISSTNQGTTNQDTSEETKDIGWFTESFINKTWDAIKIKPWGLGDQFSINVPKEIKTTIFSGHYPDTDFSKTPLIKLGSSFIGSKQVELTVKDFGIEEKNKETLLWDYTPEADALIVPEYEVNQSYFNSIFTGGELQYEKIGKYDNVTQSGKFIINSGFTYSNNQPKKAYIIGVPENTPAVRAKNKIYSSVAGNASEAHKVKVPFADFRIIADTTKKNQVDGVDMKTDDVDVTWACRGIWGPYVGIEEKHQEQTAPYEVINITIPNYDDIISNVDKMLANRKDDSSEYYPISDRISIEKTSIECFRGDCFICNFAHTMNRNFADPSFPINTDIADYNTWYKGYRTKYDVQNDLKNPGHTSSDFKYRVLDKHDMAIHTDSLIYLNRSDVNAVALGHILVTKVYSSTNLCMRSTDGSNITERATFNQVRSFYPLRSNGGAVSNKIADSYVQNGAYEKSLGEQMYVLQEEVPALKTNFSNRIVYSDLAVKDSYINNFRTFRKTAFQDYTRQYGEIVKLVNYYDGYLICVFEHAIALIEVNERAVATNSQSGFSYIDTNKVLSDKPRFLSTEYGSQWADSVIQTATGVYGIDTVAKKIWHYGDSFEVLSDLKLQKFLKDNLDVNEQETKPNVLSLNVKSHYNKHKQDLMFTFFKVIGDDYLGWNLCYNEITKKFTTFYSWIPSYSGNINNIYYSFDNEYSLQQGDLKTQKAIDANYLWEHNKENNWCNWYDEQHPFEFEFIVADNPNVHKIFNNLKMIANKTQPESFHYEVVGQVYDFKDEKPNMYYRQEKTKQVYSNNYQDTYLSYDKDYKDKVNPNRNPKSVMFPLTVSHVDKKNKIYDTYQQLTSKSQDYQSMSGSEIVYDSSANEFDVATHIKAYPIDGYEWQAICGVDEPDAKRLKQYYMSHNVQVKEENGILYKKIEYGRRLGNCKYAEDNWDIQIPSINYAEKNETWTNEPPINVAMNPIPEDLIAKGEIEVPQDVETDYWGRLKQTRIRDKYVRIRVRYTGDQLAIISAIITQYKESYN